MPQFRTLRSSYPQPTIRVYTPNNPRKLEPVRLALKLQRLDMAKLCRMGRRLVKKILMARVDNDRALAYYVARFRQVAAENKFRITKAK